MNMFLIKAVLLVIVFFFTFGAGGCTIWILGPKTKVMTTVLGTGGTSGGVGGGVSSQAGEVGIPVTSVGTVPIDGREILVTFIVLNKVSVHITGYNIQWYNSKNTKILEMDNFCDVYLVGSYRTLLQPLNEFRNPPNTGYTYITIAPQQVVEQAIKLVGPIPQIEQDYEKINVSIIFKGIDENGKNIYEEYNDDEKIRVGVVLHFFQNVQQ